MVTAPRQPGPRRGASTLGCLVGLLLGAVVLYYSIDIGRMYWKYYKLTDEMEVSARFAQDKTDAEIQRHLSEAAQELEIAIPAQRFIIRRTERPSVVSIRTESRTTLELPFHHRVVILRPHVAVRQ
jgi:hypothetical protein